MASTFDAQVDAWVRQTQARVRAVYRQSVQSVVDQAQTPTFKGGNMRVDTGFLRNTGTAALNGLPSGPSSNPNTTQPEWRGESLALVLSRADTDDEVVFGWTANYARVREAQDGFMRLAVQNWDQIVQREARNVRRRVMR